MSHTTVRITDNVISQTDDVMSDSPREAYVTSEVSRFQSVASNKKVRRLVHLTSLTSMKIQNLTEPLDGQTKLPLGQASWIGMSVAINSNRTIHNQQDFRQKRQWQDGFQVSMWSTAEWLNVRHLCLDVNFSGLAFSHQTSIIMTHANLKNFCTHHSVESR